MAGAVEAARANGERNGVAVDWAVADLEADPVPLAALLLINAPPPVHARVAAALRGDDAAGGVRHVVLSGTVPSELGGVLDSYATAGWAVAAQLEEDGWAAARLEPAGA
jgi:ribosomal protein L11 methyltransferase